MTVNLILAICWLALALGSFLYLLFQPDGKAFLFNGVSPAWVAGMSLLMFGYNMLRWWFVRVQRRQRQIAQRAPSQSDLRDQERNPDFDFSNEPKKTDGI
jgi:hypothetical protein